MADEGPEEFKAFNLGTKITWEKFGKYSKQTVRDIAIEKGKTAEEIGDLENLWEEHPHQKSSVPQGLKVGEIEVKIEESVARGLKRGATFLGGSTDLSELDDGYLKREVERLSPLPKSPLVALGNVFITTEVLSSIVSKCMSSEGKSVDEHKLIVHFSPLLDAVLRQVYSSAVLLNSEEYKWIKCHFLKHMNNLKPDLTVVLRGLQIGKIEPKPDELKAYRKSEVPSYHFEFGHPNWAFLDGLKVVIEWKGIIQPMDFVAMYRYLLHLSYERGDILFHGLLCDCKGFYVFECINGDIRDTIRWYLWDKPGSLDAIRETFTPNLKDSNWSVLLRNALIDLNVDLAASDAFLGGGAFGRVFKVLDNNNAERALKIVLTHRHSKHTTQELKQMCCNEFSALENFQDVQQFVVGVVPDSLREFRHQGDLFGMYYLLQEVGTTVNKEDQQEVKLAFNALVGIHNAKRYHGDARVTNCVIIDGSAKWIDFIQYTGIYNIYSCMGDLSHFIKSVNESELNIDFVLLQQYFSDPSAKCEEVFQSLFP